MKDVQYVYVYLYIIPVKNCTFEWNSKRNGLRNKKNEDWMIILFQIIFNVSHEIWETRQGRWLISIRRQAYYRMGGERKAAVVSTYRSFCGWQNGFHNEMPCKLGHLIILECTLLQKCSVPGTWAWLLSKW